MRRFPAGSRIVTEGEAGDTAYMISRGRAVVSKMVDGQKQVVRELGPGGVFGELAVVSRRPRTATVEALDDVLATEVSARDLAEAVPEETLAGAFLHSLVDRFRQLEERLTQLERKSSWMNAIVEDV